MVWNLNSKPRESVSFERAPEEGYSSLGILFFCLQRPKPNYELFSRKLCSEEMHIEETGTPQRSAAGQGKIQPDVTTCRPVALCTESVQERNKSSILQLVRAVWLHRWDSMFSLMQRKSVLHIPNAWFQSGLCSVQSVWAWTSYLRPLIIKRIIRAPTPLGAVKIKWVNIRKMLGPFNTCYLSFNKWEF